MINFYLGFDNKKKQSISSCPTMSDWFRRFALGCKKRMGQDVRPQLGLSIQGMLEMMKELERRFQMEEDENERNVMINAGAYVMLSLCCLLRGNEGFLLDLAGLNSHIQRGTSGVSQHVAAPLLGRFKGEDGENIICCLCLLSLLPV